MGERWTDEDIHRMIGIMMVNSLGIDLGSKQERFWKANFYFFTGKEYGELTGFYPVFSNINHSCIANCKPVKRPDMKVHVIFLRS